MPLIMTPLTGKRCGCGARRDKTTQRCPKCQARARYRRKTHYKKAAQRRARHFGANRNQRKDMPS